VHEKVKNKKGKRKGKEKKRKEVLDFVKERKQTTL